MAKAFFGGVHPNPMKDATCGKAIEKQEVISVYPRKEEEEFL